MFPISDEFIWWCILTEFLTFFLCCRQFWQPTHTVSYFKEESRMSVCQWFHHNKSDQSERGFGTSNQSDSTFGFVVIVTPLHWYACKVKYMSQCSQMQFGDNTPIVSKAKNKRFSFFFQTEHLQLHPNRPGDGTKNFKIT